jgi:hypothetical protein
MPSITITQDDDHLSSLPAELLFKITSLLIPDPKSLGAFLLVSRSIHQFSKSHEAALVRNATQYHDPLAHKLLYQSHPSFYAFFNLPHNERTFQLFVHERTQEGRLSIKPYAFRDPGFWSSPLSQLILRAGFLVHYGLVITPRTHDKAVYIESLPLAQWAFLNTFVLFLLGVIDSAGHQIFPRSKPQDGRKYILISDFISELAIYAGLSAVQDYLQLRTNSLDMESTADMARWAQSFESKHLTNSASVLSDNAEELCKHLALSSNIMFNMSIMLGRNIFSGKEKLCCADRYFFDDILTALGILHSAVETETTLLQALHTSQGVTLQSTKQAKIRIAPLAVPLLPITS